MNDRQAETRAQIEQAKKANKPVPQPLQDEFDRFEDDKAKIQSQISQKRKEIAECNQNYDAMKKRFLELKALHRNRFLSRAVPVRQTCTATGSRGYARARHARSCKERSLRQEIARLATVSFFFSSALTWAGLALPLVAFMTWPTSELNAFSLPLL